MCNGQISKCKIKQKRFYVKWLFVNTYFLFLKQYCLHDLSKTGRSLDIKISVTVESVEVEEVTALMSAASTDHVVIQLENVLRFLSVSVALQSQSQ